MIFYRFTNLTCKYGNRHFWCREYFVDTVGRKNSNLEVYPESIEREHDGCPDQYKGLHGPVYW